MKKWCLFLSVYLCLCILAACGAAGGGSPAPVCSPLAEPQTGGETARLASVTTSCWVVTAEERTWLNDYHRRVYETLSPLLEPEVAAWLRDVTPEL